MPLYLYWGEEEYTIEKKAKSLKSQVISNDLGSLSYKKLTNPSLLEMIETIQNAPAMFGDSLVKIETTIFLRGDKTRASSDELLNRLIEIMENTPNNLHILFINKIEKGSKKKIDSTSKLVKTIKKFGDIQEFPAFKPWEEDKILNWIQKNAKEKNLTIANDASKHLLSCVGPDLRKLNNETEKLGLLAFPNKSITINEAKSVLSSYENVFALADYYLANDKENVALELHKLLDKEHPVKIIAALQSSVKKWLKLKSFKNTPPIELSKDLGLHEYVVKLELKKLSSTKESEIIEFRKKLHKAEVNIKTGKMPANLALEIALLG